MRALRVIILGVFAVFAIALSWAALTPASVASAATSNTLNFQARLETSSGSIVADGDYNVEFKLYDTASTGGTAQGVCTGGCLWMETRTYNSGPGASDVRVHVANGYLTVNLGSVTAFASTINWNQQLWLAMNIGGTVGSGSISWDNEMTPRLQLTAVPYAFQAGALSATSGSNIGKLSFGTISGADTIALPDASGTVCLQSSSACGFATGSGTAFLQGGNSFGALAVLGTSDSNGLAFRTNGVNRWIMDTSGNIQLQQASTFNVVSAATGTNLTIQGGAATSGTNVGGNLTLQGGAGASTGASGSVIVKSNGNNSTTAFQVQNASSAAVLAVDTANNTTTLYSGNDHATVGSELYAGTFGSGWATTNWTLGGGNTTATHTTGNTSALTNSGVAITSGNTYEFSFTVTGNCNVTNKVASPSVDVSLGGVIASFSFDSSACNGDTNQFVVTATSSAGLSFTPSTFWSGTISNISIKQITGVINPVLSVKNASSATSLEVRANSDVASVYVGPLSGEYATTSSVANTALGYSTLSSITDGSSNTAVGSDALQKTTIGYSNAGFGDDALLVNTTGYENAAFGEQALVNNGTGIDNTAVGSFSLQNNRVGAFNVSVGAHALASNTTGSYNTAVGPYAGSTDSNGFFSTLSNLQDAAAIGAYAQVQASNSIILGSVDTATKVGIGITVPSSTFSVSPLDYQTGTVTRTNSSAALVGTGTTWTSAMVGDLIVFADGTTNTVSVFTDATHITLGATYAGTTDASPVHYRFHHIGLQVTSSGNVGIGNVAPSSPLQVSNAMTTAAPWINIDGSLTASPGGFPAGILSQPAYTGTGTQAGFEGISANAVLNGSGTISSLFDLVANPQVSATATGTISALTGLYVRNDNNSSAGGTIGTSYGIRIAAPVTTGTITNNYALVTEASAGNVGIGTIAPGAHLVVTSGGNSSTSYTAQFQSSSSVNGAGGILFDQNNTYSYKLSTQATSLTTGQLIWSYINHSTGADQYSNILTLQNGNVGIGTASPQNPLDVSGGAVIGASYAGTNTAPANGLRVQGDVVIGSTSLTGTLGLNRASGDNLITLQTNGTTQAFIGVTNTAGNVIVGSTVGDLLIRSQSKNILFSANSGSSAQLTVQATTGNLQVGSSTTDATAVLLIADSYNQSTDPTCTNGGIYYNTNMNQFRGCRNGTWYNLLTGVDVQTFTSSGSWTRPAGSTLIEVIACGGGGGGGAGSLGTAGTARAGGTGGGGGAHVQKLFIAGDVVAVGSAVTVTVAGTAAGGTVGGGGAGAASSFGSFLTAAGGGGGAKLAAVDGSGGGGGGLDAAANGGTSNAAGGDHLTATTATWGSGYAGGDDATFADGGPAEYGGGAGGGVTGAGGAVGKLGGGSIFGGGGGGGGGGLNTSNTNRSGGAGGGTGSFAAGGGGTGGASGTGVAGTGGDSTHCGTGGGGGASNGGAGTNGGNGGNGGGPGGGGGGGGAGITGSTGSAGGSGAAGEVWVISW